LSVVQSFPRRKVRFIIMAENDLFPSEDEAEPFGGAESELKDSQDGRNLKLVKEIRAMLESDRELVEKCVFRFQMHVKLES